MTASHPDSVELLDGTSAAFVGAGQPAEAVNGPMIRMWCEAVEDANPLYHDAEVARAHGHDDIVAPPAMLMVWTFEPTWTPGHGAARPHVRDLPEIPGYPNGAVLDVAQTYRRYLEVGERPTILTYYRGPSGGESDTHRGSGLVTRRVIVLVDDEGGEIARQEIGVLRFGVLEQKVAEPPARPDVPAGEPVAVLDPSSRPGARGPTLVVPLTVKKHVIAAGAARDFYDLHIDPAFARSIGAHDMFISTQFMQGTIARYVTDWTGPDATLRSLSFVPYDRNHPGDDVAVEGVVVAKGADADGHVAELSVTTRNPRAVSHVARVVVSWPDKVA